jgi:hypothetical protein
MEKESITVPIYKGDETACSNYHNFIQNCIQYPLLMVISICRPNYWQSSVWDSTLTDQLLIRFFAFVGYWRKKGSTMRQYISYSWTSVKREVLYNILIEFGVPMKLVRLIKMCL